MLYSHDAMLSAGPDPVLQNVVERTGVLRSGLVVRRFGNRKRCRVLIGLSPADWPCISRPYENLAPVIREVREGEYDRDRYRALGYVYLEAPFAMLRAAPAVDWPVKEPIR
jgi:hypothetical protein